MSVIVTGILLCSSRSQKSVANVKICKNKNLDTYYKISHVFHMFKLSTALMKVFINNHIVKIYLHVRVCIH